MTKKRKNNNFHQVEAGLADANALSKPAIIIGIVIIVFIGLLAISGFILSIVAVSNLPQKVNQYHQCSSDSDCEDSDVCTLDICQVNGLCLNVPILQCNPFSIAENVLYVSPKWIPSISNSSFYFTTLSAALLQATTYTRTYTSPVVIFVYPGVYNENITLIPNIVITGINGQFESVALSVEITGKYFNYIDATSRELVGIFISNLAIYSNNITIDFSDRSGADGSQTFVNFDNCQVLPNSMTYHARPAAPVGVDLIYFTSCDVSGFTATGVGAVTLEFSTGYPNPITLQNEMTLFVISCDLFGPNFLLSESTVDMYNTYCEGSVNTISSNSSFFGYNSVFDGGSFTINSGTSVDVRSSELLSVTFSGSGTLARTLFISQNVASSQGINTFNISPPYPNTNFNVLWSQVGGVNNQDIKLTSKTASAFQWNDTVGGNHYDFTLLMP